MAENRRKLSSPVLGCSDVAPGQKLIMLLICSLMSGAVVAGYGGVLFICAAAGILAYAMCAGIGVLPVALCGALSLGFGYLVGGRFPLVLIALLYVPMAAVIRICIGKRKGLFFTVSALTATLVLIGAATLGVMYLACGEWTANALSSLYNAYRDYITDYVSSLYNAKGLPVSRTVLDALLEAMIMATPSVVVVTLTAFSYLSAKICRLASMICDSSTMFEGNRWPVRAPLGATLIFAVSFLLALFSRNAVIMYSASNLMMIFLPGCAVYGLNLLLHGRRRKASLFGRILLIVLCIMSVYTGGVILIMVAAYYAVLYNVKQWLLAFVKENSEKE